MLVKAIFLKKNVSRSPLSIAETRVNLHIWDLVLTMMGTLSKL